MTQQESSAVAGVLAQAVFQRCGCAVERCELDKPNLFPRRLLRAALGSASKFGFSEEGGGESPGRESSSRAAPGNRVCAG